MKHHSFCVAQKSKLQTMKHGNIDKVFWRKTIRKPPLWEVSDENNMQLLFYWVFQTNR
jgi:murein L,D-transpeptidase YafK